MREPTEAQRPLAEQATAFLFEQLTRQTKRPARDLAKLAGALRSAGEQLDGNLASPYLARTAARLDKLVDLLQVEPDEAFDAVQRFAREQPFAFVGGALLAGFSGARFFKSSAHSANSRSTQSSTRLARRTDAATTKTDGSQRKES